MKTLHIYFHKDFDGIASAALLMDILFKLHLYEDFKLYPVDYHMMNSWLDEHLNTPSAVLDFLYHPDAEYYFDHHSTSFLTETLKSNYVNDKQHYWNPNFKSTPSLLKYNFEDRVSFQEHCNLIHWSDIIDSAGYSSPKVIYDNSEKHILFNKLISKYYEDDNFFVDAANQILHFGVSYLLEKYKTDADQLVIQEEKNIRLLKDYIKVQDNICIFDQSGYDLPYQRYLPYYFYPDIDFTIGIYRKKGFSISIGYNPWKKVSPIDLGKLAKRFGGGGRRNVAGILAATQEEVKQIVESIYSQLKLEMS